MFLPANTWKTYTHSKDSKTAIAIKKDIPHFFLSNHSTEHYCCLITYTPLNGPILFISAYTPPSTPDPHLSNLTNEITAIQGKISQICLAADTNAHSALWGYPSSDWKARKWEEFLLQHKLNVLDSDAKYTFCNSRNFTSRIDITAITQGLVNHSQYKIDNIETTLSDHSYIHTTFKSIEMPPKIIQNFQKVNWPNFRQNLQSTLNEALPAADDMPLESIHLIDKAINSITTITREAIDATIPKFTITELKNKWWTTELTECKKTLKRMKRKKDNQYPQQKEKYQQLILKSKTEAWRNFLEQTQTQNDAFIRHKILNKYTPWKTLEPIQTATGFTTSPTETARAVLKNIFPSDDSTEDNDFHKEIRTSTSKALEGLEGITIDPFDKPEIYTIINNLKTRKAPGIDQIPSIVIKECQDIYEPYLRKIYNRCLELSYFPTAWKQGKITLLPKPGQSSPQTHKSYRPITLLPNFGKIFEKLLLRRLEGLDYHEKWMSVHQYGFQKGQNTTNAILNITSQLHSAFKKRQETLGIFLDIAGAFDSTWHPAIIFQLIQRKCPLYLTKIINSFISNRTATIDTANGTASTSLQRSCPQGSPLSPFLFNLVVDSLLSKINSNSFAFAQAYADDVAILIHGNNRKELQRRANSLLNEVHKWSQEWKMIFNAKKSEAVIFSKLKQNRQQVKLNLNEEEIVLKDNAKYLGVILDCRLTFKKHLEATAARAKKFLHALQNASTHQWGIKPSDMRTIYSLAIEPILTYACAAWISALKRKYAIAILRSVQRQAAISITGCLRSTSTDALLILANLTPIHLRIQALCVNSYVKLHNYINFLPLHNIHSYIQCHNQSEQHLSSLQTSQQLCKDMNINPNLLRKQAHPYNLHLPPPSEAHNAVSIEERQQAIQRAMETAADENTEIIYTDASKLGEGHTGSAAVRQTQSGYETIFQLKYTENTSVFCGELLALDNSLDYVLHNSTNNSIKIFSDSLSNLTTIPKASTNPDTTSVQNKIKNITNRGQQITLHWVPGHHGIPGNEAADSAAKEASTMIAPPQEQPPSLTQIKNITKEEMKKIWQSQWDSSSKGRILYHELPKVQTKELWNLLSSENKRDSSLIAQLLTGHIPLNAHLHRINRSTSPLCPHCNTTETTQHFIYNCDGNLDLQTAIEQATMDSTDPSATSLLKILQIEDIRKHILASLRTRLKTPNNNLPTTQSGNIHPART